MTVFKCREMQWRVQDHFSILLPAADAVRMSGEKLKISSILAVPQAHCQPRLILNLPEKPDEGTSSVNKINRSEVAPESMQFK